MKKNSEQLADSEDLTCKKKMLRKEQTQLIRSEGKKMKILNTLSFDLNQKRDDQLKVLLE